MSDHFPVLQGAEHSVFDFTPPGPVGQAFLDSTDPIPFIMGPWGSGKTTVSIFKTVVNTMRMPVCKDGVIRARGCVIRDNFRTLYRTTLESWFRFFPREFGHFEGGQDRPAKHTLRFATPRGRLVEMVVDFYAIGNHAVEELLKGYEPSWGWINEADLTEQRVATWLYGRAALERYPPRSMLADPNASYSAQVWGDLNPPLLGHWIEQDFVTNPKPGFRLFRQPSGLSPDAENRTASRPEKYAEMAKTMRPDEVRRFVHGEFGHVADGAPIYPEFSYARHVPRVEMEPVDGLPIQLGLDAGGTPSAIVRQAMPNGQVRWLSELCADFKSITGPGRFAEMLVDHLTTRYRGCPVSLAFGDPAAFYGNDRQAGELSWMETISRAIGVPINPAPSNDPGLRQEAVAWALRRTIDGETEAFQVNPSCKWLVGGFMGHYKMALNAQNTVAKGSSAVKNEYSHPHDAGQYVELGTRGRMVVINEAARAGRPGDIIRPVFGQARQTDFNVWNV